MIGEITIAATAMEIVMAVPMTAGADRREAVMIGGLKHAAMAG